MPCNTARLKRTNNYFYVMKSILFYCLILVAGHTLAQDSLVRFSEVRFLSSYESSTLSAFLKSPEKSNFFLLFLAASVSSEDKGKEASNRFYQVLATFETEKFNARKNDRKIKDVYDAIHNTFLAKYSEQNTFGDIFSNGEYNCVSGSALFAIAFNKLSIPYQIKEKPTHVYLIAFPEKERIIVEATAPVNGYQTIAPAFKQQFVKILKDQKLISNAEFSSRSVDENFDSYFFKDQENISLAELAGIQYANKGLESLTSQDYEIATNNFAKAHWLYPSKKHEYLLYLSISSAFSRSSATDDNHAILLAQLSRFKKYGVNNEQVKGEYYRVIKSLLFEKGDNKALEKYNQKLATHVIDSSLRKDLQFLFHYEQGRLLYNQGKYEEAIQPLKQSFALKHHDQDCQQLLLAALGHSIRNQGPKRRIEVFENIASEIPTLKTNNHFNQDLGMAYLMHMQTLFNNDAAPEGEKVRLQFENFLKENPKLTFDQQLIAYAYGTAGVYYFRKNQTAKARAIINKGLEISPDNYELLARKKMIQ